MKHKCVYLFVTLAFNGEMVISRLVDFSNHTLTFTNNDDLIFSFKFDIKAIILPFVCMEMSVICSSRRIDFISQHFMCETCTLSMLDL